LQNANLRGERRGDRGERLRNAKCKIEAGEPRRTGRGKIEECKLESAK
jgi:hypothetical protein